MAALHWDAAAGLRASSSHYGSPGEAPGLLATDADGRAARVHPLLPCRYRRLQIGRLVAESREVTWHLFVDVLRTPEAQLATPGPLLRVPRLGRVSKGP